MNDLKGIQHLALKITNHGLDSYDERLQGASIETTVDDLEIRCAVYCYRKKYLHQRLCRAAPEPAHNTR